MIDKPNQLAEGGDMTDQPSGEAPQESPSFAPVPPAADAALTTPDPPADEEKEENSTQPPTAAPDGTEVRSADEPPLPAELSADGLSADELSADELSADDGEPAVEEQRDEALGEPPDSTDEPTLTAEIEAQPVAETVAEEELADEKDWYILKVQSNRENSVADALRRRVTIEGLDDYFGQVIVPTEKVTEFKGGKKRVVHRKLYPGYILVEMAINDDTWFLVRETPGIGDFTGSGGKPTPMLAHEVQRIVSKQDEKTDAAPKLKVSFSAGDRVKINEGTFESFEGEVSGFDPTSGHVTVMINIFGRSTPVELEYWQIERI